MKEQKKITEISCDSKSPSIYDQVKDSGIYVPRYMHSIAIWESVRFVVIRMYHWGYLYESEMNKVLRRIEKEIMKELNK